MSLVSYNSNSIVASNLINQTSKSLFSFGTNVFINGNVGIGTIYPLHTFHVEDLTFNMKITTTNEQSIYSNTYNQYYGLLPIGSIVIIPSQRLVSMLINHGWLECNGTTYAQTNYPLLEPLLRNINYGNGTGFNSTFKVPDFRNRIPIGAGGTYSQSYYNTNTTRTITINTNHLPPHSHSGNTNGPNTYGSHSHSGSDTSTNYNAASTNTCCGGSATNYITAQNTDQNSSVNHSHGASWGQLNNTSLTAISLERNKVFMIYMIKGS